jgi:ABC-2 type transport system permease protein
MRGLLLQLAVSLRLHFRNRMALIYGYLFPTIFLLAFWVLYRYERPPLVRHMGELLTVTILGGACFGLPTTLVSERERGVWRRYRLTPVPTGNIVASTVGARYLLLLTAGVIQILLAMLIGMPAPRHPLDLFVAFTFVAFAFMGLGLVIATLADNVPAVQALGQCIFLPMLIIGGIAVPLASLPEWAQHLSAFFPGRYAVEAIDAAMLRDGLGAARFDLVALLLIGLAGCLAGARLFRWDSQQRFAALPGKGWVVVALAAWAAVGLGAEARNRILVSPPQTAQVQPPPAAVTTPAPDAGQAATPAAPPPSPTDQPSAEASAPHAAEGSSAAATPPQNPASTSAPAASAPSHAAGATAPAATPPPVAATPPPVAAAPGLEKVPSLPTAPAAAAPTPEWQKSTIADIDREIDFSRLPPDDGVVTPIAPFDEMPAPEVDQQLQTLYTRLPDWPPGKVPDLVQRTRNLLYVAAVPDVIQAPIERYAPLAVYDRLQEDIPKPQLIQVLFWIALHPMDGDDSAIAQLPILGLNYPPTDPAEVRNRAAFYAVKLLGRLTGRIIPR